MRKRDRHSDPHHTYTPFGQRVHKLEDPYNWEEQRDFEKVFQFYWYVKRVAYGAFTVIKGKLKSADKETRQSKMKDKKSTKIKAAE